MKQTIALILFLMLSNLSIVSAHQWEFSLKDSSGKSIFVDKSSVINVNSLVNFGEPYFQAFVKYDDKVIVCAFRLHNGTRYICTLPLEKDVENLIYMPSTTAQKRQAYGEMLEMGVAPHIARAAAESYHDEFREKTINKMSEGIIKYGLNDKGAINPIGIYLLFNLANENPQYTAQLIQQLPFSTDFEEIHATSIAALLYDEVFKYAIMR